MIMGLNQHILPLPHIEQHVDMFERLGPMYIKSSMLTP
jgi:hypothetical protein